MNFKIYQDGKEITCDIILTFRDNNNDINYIKMAYIAAKSHKSSVCETKLPTFIVGSCCVKCVFYLIP